MRLNDREDFGMWMWLLVFAQFLLAAAMVLSISWWPIPWKVLVLGLPGILLAFAAWFQMGWKRLRIHPSASSQPRLVMDGPYRLVNEIRQRGAHLPGQSGLPEAFAMAGVAEDANSVVKATQLMSSVADCLAKIAAIVASEEPR